MSDIYPMFIEPTIARDPSGFSGYIIYKWLNQYSICGKTRRGSATYVWLFLTKIVGVNENSEGGG